MPNIISQSESYFTCPFLNPKIAIESKVNPTTQGMDKLSPNFRVEGSLTIDIDLQIHIHHNSHMHKRKRKEITPSKRKKQKIKKFPPPRKRRRRTCDYSPTQPP